MTKRFLPLHRSPGALGNWQVSRFGSMWVEPDRYKFNSVRTGLKSRCVWLYIAFITIHSRTNSAYLHLDQTQIVILKVTTRVHSVLHCRLRRVNVAWNGSIWILIRINFVVCAKNVEDDQNVFSVVLLSVEYSGIHTCYDAGDQQACLWNFPKICLKICPKLQLWKKARNILWWT
jgi:hypothetical protein